MHSGRSGLATLGHAIGITGEDRFSKLSLLQGGSFRTRPAERLDLAGDALDVRGHRGPLVEDRQQIGSCRRPARWQHMPFGEKRRGVRHFTRAAGGDEHSCETRMERETSDLIAESGQSAVMDEPQSGEQQQRALDRVLARPFEPFEMARIASPGDHVQQRAREIDVMNFRLTPRTQPISGVPKPHDDTGARPRRPASTLIRGVGRNTLEIQAVDPAIGIVPRDFLQA